MSHASWRTAGAAMAFCWVAAVLSAAAVEDLGGAMSSPEDAIPDLAFGAQVVQLDEKNFEHLTQAATGATSGDWLVVFCKDSVPRCARITAMWEKMAVSLSASREARGLPRINVAAVDTKESPWLTKRFGITSVPLVLLFKGGVMYSFHGGGFSIEKIQQFAERDYERSSRMLVPPEPHVATPHDQTFLFTIGTVAIGAAVLWLVDQALAQYYKFQKRRAKRAAKAAAKAGAAATIEPLPD